MFQGESDKAQENEYLGTLTVNDLPKGPRGTAQFDVMFALSPEALLTVTAEEHGTARTVIATFTTKATPEEIRKRLEAEEETPQAQSQSPAAVPEAAAPAGGVMGWLRRLFGGGKGQQTGA